MGEKLKSIKGLAEELNTSKQNIRNIIKKLGLQSTLQKKSNKFLIDEREENLIKSEFNKDYNKENSKKITKKSSDDFAIYLDLFQEELRKKNEQLEAKDIQIKELHKLLDQQQKLNLQTQNLLSETQLKLENRHFEKVKEENNIEKKWWQIWKKK